MRTPIVKLTSSVGKLTDAHVKLTVGRLKLPEARSKLENDNSTLENGVFKLVNEHSKFSDCDLTLRKGDFERGKNVSRPRNDEVGLAASPFN